MKKTILIIAVFISLGTLFSCSTASAGKKRDRAIFTGVTALDVDKTCLPDKCNDMCLSACDSIAGEACKNAFDVGQACLSAHPPATPFTDAEALIIGMDECLVKNKEEFVKDRCRFSDSLLDHRPFVDGDPKGVCEDIFKEYQDCLKKGTPEIASVAKCQELIRKKADTNKCAFATAANTRRLFGTIPNNKVRCFIKCDEVK